MSPRIDVLGRAARAATRQASLLDGTRVDASPAIARRLDGVLPAGPGFASALRMQVELARRAERAA